jgi:2-isopropylmalate synthase
MSYAQDLIFDWNEVRANSHHATNVTVFDDTLRDGLQNPSAVEPSLAEKLELVNMMPAVGIDGATIAFPARSRRAFDEALYMCREVDQADLPLRIVLTGRTVRSDITPIVEIAQKTGVPVLAYVFIGSSPIRHFVEDWDLDFIVKQSADAIDFLVKSGLSVAYITEDTTRSRPDHLRTLFKIAMDHGAERICLTDTVGHATPAGVENLVRFTRGVIDDYGANVAIDWHGHNDRGFALDNAIRAVEVGADRVHATALGIGERVGNTPIELLLMNLKMMGILDRDLRNLPAYCRMVARATQWTIPTNYPMVGRDAFRTATGVHAAAIVKALSKGYEWLADRVYSSISAAELGRRQEIGVGPSSGASNVIHWLRQWGIEERPAIVEAILAHAKASDHVLTDGEIAEVARMTGRASLRPPPDSGVRQTAGFAFTRAEGE